MESIRQNILEYEKSAEVLNTRIQELHLKIKKAGEAEAAALNERRYALYKMLWEIQQDIREMREYDRQSQSGAPLVQAKIPHHSPVGRNDIGVGQQIPVHMVSV